VLKLCRIVNLGCNVAMRSDPFWYLERFSRISNVCRGSLGNLPDSKCAAVRRWCKSSHCYLVQGPRRNVLRRSRFEKDNGSLGVS